MSLPETVIPKGSTVLVTGANGYIASNIIHKLLQLGFRVHGTVRDRAGRSWVADEIFSAASKDGTFKLFEVNDMTVPNAFGDAIVGASAICFVGTNDMAGIPEKVIPGETNSLTNLLETATNTPTVKRFVVLSTAANAYPMPGAADVPFHVTKDSWNDLAPKVMHELPPGPEKSMAVYVASKIEAEKLLWKFREERRPHFGINVVNSSFCLGKKLNKRQMGSTIWIEWLFAGDATYMPMLPNASYVHVSDVAWANVGALLDPACEGERLPVWGKPFNWNDVLAIMRKQRPDHKFMSDVPNLGEFLPTADDEDTRRLVLKWSGQKEYIPLEQAVRENMEGHA